MLARREVRRPRHHVTDAVDVAAQLHDVDARNVDARPDGTFDDLFDVDVRDGLDPAAGSPAAVRGAGRAGDDGARGPDHRRVVGDEKRGSLEGARSEQENGDEERAHGGGGSLFHRTLYFSMVYTIHHPALMTPVTVPLIFDRPTRFR